jgi:pilus assembly protein Flp/PilA
MMMAWEILKALRNQKGQGMVEYGLILGIISIAAITLMTPVGAEIVEIFTAARDGIQGR